MEWIAVDIYIKIIGEGRDFGPSFEVWVIETFCRESSYWVDQILYINISSSSSGYDLHFLDLGTFR